MTRLYTDHVAPRVLVGSLRIVLRDAEPPPLPVHLITPQGRTATPKVRAFLDFAAPRLKAHGAIPGCPGAVVVFGGLQLKDLPVIAIDVSVNRSDPQCDALSRAGAGQARAVDVLAEGENLKFAPPELAPLAPPNDVDIGVGERPPARSGLKLKQTHFGAAGVAIASVLDRRCHEDPLLFSILGDWKISEELMHRLTRFGGTEAFPGFPVRLLKHRHGCSKRTVLIPY